MNLIKSTEKVIRNQEEILAYAKQKGMSRTVMLATQAIVAAQELLIHLMQLEINNKGSEKVDPKDLPE